MIVTDNTTLGQLAGIFTALDIERWQGTITAEGIQLHLLTKQGWLVDAIGPTLIHAMNAAIEVIQNKRAEKKA